MNERNPKPQAPTPMNRDRASKETPDLKVRAKEPEETVTAPVGRISIVRWFLSKTVRQAAAMRKHVEKILNHQRDSLSPQAVSAVQTAMRELQRAAAGRSDAAAI